MRALIVYKKSLYQIYVQEKNNAHIKSLLEAKDVTVKDLIVSHEANQQTIEHVQKVLTQKGFNVRSRYRGDADMVKDADIVFSVGGDGTLLWTQKYVGKNIPVFGVNSDPGHSVGYLCTANNDTFEKVLDYYMLDDQAKTIGPTNRIVQRLSVKKNGEVLSSRVLNDVLFCHKNPAATSSYLVREANVLGQWEAQKSSGVWIATPVGSTAAIHSAGGQKMHLSDVRFQYKVREPYTTGNKKYRTEWGFLDEETNLELTSKMREAILALDGARDTRSVQMGDKITIGLSDEPLTLVKP